MLRPQEPFDEVAASLIKAAVPLAELAGSLDPALALPADLGRAKYEGKASDLWQPCRIITEKCLSPDLGHLDICRRQRLALRIFCEPPETARSVLVVGKEIDG